jgi:hypothetical protein
LIALRARECLIIFCCVVVAGQIFLRARSVVANEQFNYFIYSRFALQSDLKQWNLISLIVAITKKTWIYGSNEIQQNSALASSQVRRKSAQVRADERIIF